MLEKFKKYFPSTSSGFKQTIQNVQQPFQKPAFTHPTPEKSDLEKPLNIENIKSYLKKKFPSTTAASIAGKSTSPIGTLPSVAGSEDFVKAWKRKKERQHKSGFATYDFFPELHYMAPMEYKMMGAAPNFPEISGYSKYKLKFGFSLRDSIEGGSIGAGIKIGVDTKHIPGIYKSGGYTGWSHKTHNTLMAVDDYTLVRTKRNRMDYWKNEMDNAKTSSGRARARWNFYNIKHRALKDLSKISKEDARELNNEWNKFKNSKGMYAKDNIWWTFAGPHEK